MCWRRFGGIGPERSRALAETEAMTNAIETIKLTRRFGKLDAVDGLDLRVPSGSVFGLIGPNGAGKTTTIKLLMNLLHPSGGSARVLGRDSTKLDPELLARIGYVSESQQLPDHMTAAELFAYCRPFYSTWDPALCQSLIGLTRLPLNQRIRTMSRGMRMKAAVVASLAYRPELVILDEPFSGLDPLVRDELIRALLELTTDRKWTVLVSSHDIEELERLADWIGFIDNGRLVFAEQVASLLERYRRVEVIGEGDSPLPTVMLPSWVDPSAAGRTLRFVDTDHADPHALIKISHAFPGTQINTFPLSLRDIFLSLARGSATRSTASGGS
jgi:ABC-2 type transport system ATP-binding protein